MMRFLLNAEKFDTLAKLRGWRSRYSDLALATGLTRSYVRRVMLGEEKMSECFMLRYIKIAGANPDKPQEWGSLFVVDLNSEDPMMSLNYPKLRAQVPYEAISPSYEFRKNDDPNVEEKSFSVIRP